MDETPHVDPPADSAPAPPIDPLAALSTSELEHWEETGLLEELLYTWIPVRRVSVAVDPEA